MRKVLLVVGIFVLWGCSSGGAYAEHSSYPTSGGYAPSPSADSYMEVSEASAPRRASRQARSGRQDSSAGPVGSPGVDDGGRGDLSAVAEEERRELPERGPRLLIYSGTVVLAIFDVTVIQDQAVALIEEMGGYVSHRASTKLVLRVPAARFRDALAAVSTLGDVLDQRWDAQDVSDEVRDLDIRLRNALELRDRLEALLARAENVEEALQIEAELERITLEVERIRGQLQSFEDRIAYSTLEIHFRPRATHQVPADEYLLPFQWLNQLGLESLYRSVGGHR